MYFCTDESVWVPKNKAQIFWKKAFKKNLSKAKLNHWYTGKTAKKTGLVSKIKIFFDY